jgi:hypothetical protein
VHVFRIPITRLDPHNNSSTGLDGEIVTTTIQSNVIITQPVDASSGSSNSSNTGAIVGGIVGGIAGLVAILLIGLFCWRRNRRGRDDLGGNFDPDRIMRHVGATDLAATGATSYHERGPVGVGAATYAGQHSGPTSGGSPTSSGGGSISQYRDTQALLADSAGAATRTSGSQYAPTPSDSPLVYRSSSAHSSQQQQHQNIVSMPTKEMQRQPRPGSLGLASAAEEEEVIHHMDGGPIPVKSVAPSSPHEVPPSYDSIPV